MHFLHCTYAGNLQSACDSYCNDHTHYIWIMSSSNLATFTNCACVVTNRRGEKTRRGQTARAWTKKGCDEDEKLCVCSHTRAVIRKNEDADRSRAKVSYRLMSFSRESVTNAHTQGSKRVTGYSGKRLRLHVAYINAVALHSQCTNRLNVHSPNTIR